MMTLNQQQQFDSFAPAQFCNQKQSFEDSGSLKYEMAYLYKKLKIQENIKYKILDYTVEIMKQNQNLQQESLQLKQSITELKELNKNPYKKTCECQIHEFFGKTNTFANQQKVISEKLFDIGKLLKYLYENRNQNLQRTPNTLKTSIQ